MRWRKKGAEGTDQRVREVLAQVEAAEREVADARQAPLARRREAHTRLRNAYSAADAVLRPAAAAAKRASMADRGAYRRWARLRAQVSQLDLARQHHLFAETDDMGVLLPNSPRAVDHGMYGPVNGDALHGEQVPTGTPARIGLDMQTMDRQAPLSGVLPPYRGVAAPAVTHVPARLWNREAVGDVA